MRTINQKQSSRAEFSCRVPDATTVLLVGRLGQRKSSVRPMGRNEDCEWSAVLHLPPGLYYYKFVVVYKGVLNMPGGSATLSPGWDQQYAANAYV